MLRVRILAGLLLTGSLMWPFATALSCSECDKAAAQKRPVCEQAQMTYGICVTSDMDAAIKTTNSAAFKEAFDDVVKEAQAYLDTIPPDPKNVIITDLDETLIDNQGYYGNAKGFDPEGFKNWIHSNQHGPYKPSVLKFLQDAKAKGFSVMFITGRTTDNGADTFLQTGDIEWDGAFFRPGGRKLIRSKEYKGQVRKMLEKVGYHVVLNIGDQASDLDTPAEKKHGQFLLPNVIYNIP